jgi:hypothetical protein
MLWCHIERPQQTSKLKHTNKHHNNNHNLNESQFNHDDQLDNIITIITKHVHQPT